MNFATALTSGQVPGVSVDHLDRLLPAYIEEDVKNGCQHAKSRKKFEKPAVKDRLTGMK